MINEVIVEGIVVREPWNYMDDLFFRIVIYRDSDMPARKLDAQHDAGDYVNVRISGGANGLVRIQRGMRLRVHGFLQSRDYSESLEEFIQKVRRTRSIEDLSVEVKGCDLKPDQLLIDRSVNEIVSRRIIVLESASHSEKKQRIEVREAPAVKVEDEKGSGWIASEVVTEEKPAESLIRSPKRVSKPKTS